MIPGIDVYLNLIIVPGNLKFPSKEKYLRRFLLRILYFIVRSWSNSVSRFCAIHLFSFPCVSKQKNEIGINLTNRRSNVKFRRKILFLIGEKIQNSWI